MISIYFAIRIGGLASRMFKVAYEMKLIDDTPFKSTLLRVRSHHEAEARSGEVERVSVKEMHFLLHF